MNKATIPSARIAILAAAFVSITMSAVAETVNWANASFSYEYIADHVDTNQWDISTWAGAGYSQVFQYSKTNSQYEDWANEKQLDGWQSY
jgi:hypothetical protein